MLPTLWYFSCGMSFAQNFRCHVSVNVDLHSAQAWTSNALYALVRSKHKRFHMLPKWCLGQQQDHAGTPARSSTPTDKPQRKPVGQWCLASSMERPCVIGWQIEVVAVMQNWRPDGRNLSGTVELGRAFSWTSWHSACRRLAQVHRASAAWCAGAVTSHGQTCHI